MKEVLAASRFAHATQIAVELLFARVIIKEITCFAEVLPKHVIAKLTALSRRLHYKASIAFHLSNGFLVEGMGSKPCLLYRTNLVSFKLI